MTHADIGDRLTDWLATRIPDADGVRVEGLERVEFGYSAEMLQFAVVATTGAGEQSDDVVLRLRPPEPGLLEPYDLRRQFDILRALEPTPVRAPRALWIEESGAVLGRAFYVMERVDGVVYERQIPAELEASPERIRVMSERVMEQIAQIHLVDLAATGLDALGDGHDYLDRELEHWATEVHRWQRAPMPALETLHATLRDQRPEQTARTTLVHGDPKAGNFAFVDDEVSGIFDWEMATIGDPMADIGWAEVTWRATRPFSLLPETHVEELLARWEQRTGIATHDRAWYRAFQAYKMAVIMFVASMLFDRGFSADQRYADMGRGVPPLAQSALRELQVAG